LKNKEAFTCLTYSRKVFISYFKREFKPWAPFFVISFSLPMQNQEFINPIDKDKITENPGLLPYAHTVGGAVIKPEDQGKIKGRALAAMEQQTDMQLRQIYEQMEVLARQAKNLQRRIEISHMIYMADVSFEPFAGHTYYLYQRENGKRVLMMIAPEEWGRSCKLQFVATVRLMADHTWDILKTDETLWEPPTQSS
jgi:hypothetical protein